VGERKPCRSSQVPGSLAEAGKSLLLTGQVAVTHSCPHRWLGPCGAPQPPTSPALPNSSTAPLPPLPTTSFFFFPCPPKVSDKVSCMAVGKSVRTKKSILKTSVSWPMLSACSTLQQASPQCPGNPALGTVPPLHVTTHHGSGKLNHGNWGARISTLYCKRHLLQKIHGL